MRAKVPALRRRDTMYRRQGSQPCESLFLSDPFKISQPPLLPLVPPKNLSFLFLSKRCLPCLVISLRKSFIFSLNWDSIVCSCFSLSCFFLPAFSSLCSAFSSGSFSFSWGCSSIYPSVFRLLSSIIYSGIEAKSNKKDITFGVVNCVGLDRSSILA